MTGQAISHDRIAEKPGEGGLRSPSRPQRSFDINGQEVSFKVEPRERFRTMPVNAAAL